MEWTIRELENDLATQENEKKIFLDVAKKIFKQVKCCLNNDEHIVGNAVVYNLPDWWESDDVELVKA